MVRLILILSAFVSFNSFTQTIIWDGGAGDGKWGNPLNWDADQLPCNTRSAFISNATISISATDAERQLILESKTIFIVNTSEFLNISSQRSYRINLNNTSCLVSNGVLSTYYFNGGRILNYSNFDNFSSSFNSELLNLT
jgi:hypothetical protein